MLFMRTRGSTVYSSFEVEVPYKMLINLGMALSKKGSFTRTNDTIKAFISDLALTNDVQ